MTAETFRGTFFEVKQKLLDWKVANAGRMICREGSPVAVGEKSSLLDEPVWALTVEYEDLPPTAQDDSHTRPDHQPRPNSGT